MCQHTPLMHLIILVGSWSAPSQMSPRYLHFIFKLKTWPQNTQYLIQNHCLCFGSINTSTPTYLTDILHLYSLARCLHSRGPLCSSADIHLLKLPLYQYKTKGKGDHTFSHFGPSVWNSMPPHIRKAATITTLTSALKITSSACITQTNSALFDLKCVCVCVSVTQCICLIFALFLYRCINQLPHLPSCSL